MAHLGVAHFIAKQKPDPINHRARKLLYAAINRPAHPAQIVSVDTVHGTITPLVEVVGPALYFVPSLAWLLN